MKLFKNKLFVSLLSIVLVVVFALGITFSCIDFSSKDRDQVNSVGSSGPNNTSGYWIDSGRYGTTAWSGQGTESDPYLIQSAQDLARLSYMVYSGSGPKRTANNTNYIYENVYFKQTVDIDLSTYYWQPIGIIYNRAAILARNYFSGLYDGDFHIVTGIFTPAGSTNIYSNQGLFGVVSAYSSNAHAMIKNLGIEDSYIRGYECIGGIVGNLSNSASVQQSYSLAMVTGEGKYVGGITGLLVGTVKNSYSRGAVSGTGNYVGGIFGYSTQYATINNCYNTGSLSGVKYVGGVAGDPSTEGKTYNCLNTGKVTATDSNVGGVSGDYAGYMNMQFVYYGGECTLTQGISGYSDYTEPSNRGATKYTNLNTTSYAKNKDWYTNTANWNSSYPWDFTNTWTFANGQNDDYPMLKGFVSLPWSDFAAKSYAGGDGSKDNPYQIATAEQLALLAKQSRTSRLGNTYFLQTASIDFNTAESAKENNLLWDGINSFDGNYNGNFFTISNLRMKTNNRAGLFLHLDNGEVANVIISNSKIVAKNQAGAIAGAFEGSGIIKKCIVKDCFISNKSNNPEDGHVGGVSGYIAGNATINSCIVFNTKISSEQWEVGGITGAFYAGAVSDCALINIEVTARERIGMFNGFGSQTAVQSSYGYGQVDGSYKKIMNGNNTAWSGWEYISGLNGNYPMQKELFWMANFGNHTSQEIYNYLSKTLGFTVVS